MSRLAELCRTQYNTVKQLCIETTIEVYALATLGVFIGGMHSCNNEIKRERYIPIAYAEIGAIEDQALKETGVADVRVGHKGKSKPHGKLQPLEAYYASTNDLLAKGFESWNDPGGHVIPRMPSTQRSFFALHLDQEMDTTGRRYRHNIRDLVKVLNYTSREAIKQLSDAQTVRANISPVAQALNDSWSYTYHDNTHQECTTRVVDSKTGRTETECHTVCDSRDHYWNYHEGAGLKAARLLVVASKAQPAIQYIRMREPEATGAWNEQVIGQSIRIKDKDAKVTQEEMLRRAKLFKTGSAYELNIHDAIGLWATLQKNDLPAWHNAIRTAHDEYERTFFCTSTTGPAEYELAQDIEGRANNLYRHISNFIDPIQHSVVSVPQLEHHMKSFILAENTHWQAHFPELRIAEALKGGSANKQQKKLLSEMQQMYVQNFPGGNDVKQFRYGMVFLGILLGGLIGAGLGKAVDWQIDQMTGGNRFYNNRKQYNSVFYTRKF